MKQGWDDYNHAIEKGPLPLFFKLIIFFVIIGLTISVLGYIFGWFGEMAEVAMEEFNPRIILKKYEWLKDVSAQLDRKKADIEVYKGRLKNIESSYEDIKRKDWDRTDKEQYNLWQQEVAGVIASFNDLAAEFNAQMAKFNWRFADIGRLPEGAEMVLPREYKPYSYN